MVNPNDDMQGNDFDDDDMDIGEPPDYGGGKVENDEHVQSNDNDDDEEDPNPNRQAAGGATATAIPTAIPTSVHYEQPIHTAGNNKSKKLLPSGWISCLKRYKWILLIVLILCIIIAIVVPTTTRGSNDSQSSITSPSSAPVAAAPTPENNLTRTLTFSPTMNPTPLSTPNPTRAPSFSLTDPPTPFPTPITSLTPVTPAPILITSSPTTQTPSLVPTTVPTTTSPSRFYGSDTLMEIVARGYLNCGIQPDLIGFSVLSTATNEYEGFEADLCRAIAAAIFGTADPSYLTFIPLEPKQRLIALQTGAVDVLAAQTTITMERDIYQSDAGAGFTFTAPYLIDGLSFGGVPPYGECADKLTTEGNCTDLRICVVSGTTHVDTVTELLPDAGLSVLPSLVNMYDAFIDGLCNVIAGEQSLVSEAVVRAEGYVQEYEQGQAIHSREPLGLVTGDDDARWSDMVQWILQALMAAEEQGITQEFAQSFTTTDLFGESFSDLFINTIAAVGNYGEMYDRHLAHIMPRADVNKINDSTTGLIFSLPFGNVDIDGPTPLGGSTLARVKTRGHLKCGITRTVGFAELIDGEWVGHDADFCKAISAAIFDGVHNDIDFVDLPATQRFTELASGTVDVLSRITTWNLERDVLEPTSGTGLSFSQPTFYDGLAFGGIPPFGRCADNLDTTSDDCTDLKICVISGTTTIVRLRELFLEEYIVTYLTGEEYLRGFLDGSCNVLFGAELEVRETIIREAGFTGEYKEGERLFSKEPLAVVTRQDDPQFTSFVNWVVTATFYAEEQNITQSSALQMPTVSLFGPLYTRMLINVIEAVGNYGEIYDRNVESLLPRDGLNTLNVNPLTPQHYPLPGV